MSLNTLVPDGAVGTRLLGNPLDGITTLADHVTHLGGVNLNLCEEEGRTASATPPRPPLLLLLGVLLAGTLVGDVLAGHFGVGGEGFCYVSS